MSLLLTRPTSLPLLIAGAGTAAIGSVISDIDSGTSEAHQKSDIVIGVSLAAVVAVIVADTIWQVGIYERLRRDTNIWRMILGAAMFVAVCAFGRTRSHRSFMHSIMGLIALTACMDIFAPTMVQFFIPAFWTHIILDLFNRRRIKLFWPLKKGVCLKLCSSSGLVNKILFTVGSVGCVLAVLTSPAVLNMIVRAMNFNK